MLSSAYPVHRSVSKVNCSGTDTQVVSCHCYLVVFHPFVETNCKQQCVSIRSAIDLIHTVYTHFVYPISSNKISTCPISSKFECDFYGVCKCNL